MSQIETELKNNNDKFWPAMKNLDDVLSAKITENVINSFRSSIDAIDTTGKETMEKII